MKYYLVALFDKNSNSYVENLQRQFCKKYKVYKKQQSLYITMEVIDEPNIDALDSVLHDIIKPYKRFKVELNREVCFETPQKSINMRVEHKGYITRLSRNIDEKLKLHGFRVLDSTGNLQISLGNTNFSFKKPSNDLNFNNSTHNEPGQMVKIDRFELWRNINKKNQLVKSYPLKEY